MRLRKISPWRGLALLVFVVYTALMLKAVLFKDLARISPDAFSIEGLQFRLHTMNLVPFQTILFYLSGRSQSFLLAVVNLAGNFVLLGPLGFLLPYIFPKVSSFRRVAATSFLVSLLLEVVQLLTGLGSFDVDDLFLNVIGAMVGWLAYRAVITLLGRVGRRPAPSAFSG